MYEISNDRMRERIYDLFKTTKLSLFDFIKKTKPNYTDDEISHCVKCIESEERT